MGKRKVVNKGYTLTVKSWENDGDNYNTLSKTVDTLEEATAYYHLMQLCKSKNNQPTGVVKLGNTYDEFSEKQIKVIIDFFNNNPILIPENFKSGENEDDDYVDLFSNITYDLLSGSEDYACRVMESCIVTYSPEDVYLEEIKIQ